MEYITKKDLIDCSTPDEFCFSLCCMECKTVWKSTPIRFSKAGKKPENENRKIIYDTLYDREKNLAFQKALNQAKEIPCFRRRRRTVHAFSEKIRERHIWRRRFHYAEIERKWNRVCRN